MRPHICRGRAGARILCAVLTAPTMALMPLCAPCVLPRSFPPLLRTQALGYALHGWEDFLAAGKAAPAEPVPPSPADLCTIM